ncbi:hypothetical protein MUCCIDRAFT_109932 [Mucor lusitanicus CBS 277.49]|uniref:Uncharacterized protein n=2 Tax=Mucor circinelloides f. lusitanicus TaxID=29924 RepID=A0A162R7R0_MUCCL|nr:hypothetical protein MUCCIDRAFT_109932 [Mucor lusitanicus CBS 277.49]
MFGAGAAMGAGLEVLLIKSNYYQMLAASEAKQRLKDLKQEQEDLERYNRMQQTQKASSSTTTAN